MIGLISTLLMAAPPAGAEGGGSMIGAFMPMIIIFVIFYFLLIRPQQKQRKKTAEMLSKLEKGSHVVTVSGIHGTIVGLTDLVVTLEIAENVKIKINRNQIGMVKSEAGAT